jgi:exopolysaccharide biosynthesis polyprenyl glycosylphosphotransferase
LESKKINNDKHQLKLTSMHFQFFADIIAILLSWFVQYYVRYESGLFETFYDINIEVFIIGTFFFLIYWLIVFFFSGLYKDWYIRSPFEELFTVLKVSLFGTIFLSFSVLWGGAQRARLLFLIFFFVLTFFVGLGRIFARRLQRKLKSRGVISIPCIIIGDHERGIEFFRKVELSKYWGYRPLGIVFNTDEEMNLWLKSETAQSSNIEILGIARDIIDIIEQYHPQEIIISTKSPKYSLLMDIAAKCAEMNIRLKIEPDLYEIFTGQARTQNIYGIPLIDVNAQLMKPWEEILKRMFDIVFSLLVLLIGLPIWIMLALAVVIESRGPVFYKQERVGKGGKIFMIYKFRSMVTDADKSVKWTVINDPRVTRVGKFIRKTHLDEIPQFWNALIGNMSIVGPRPEQPPLVEQFSKELPHYKRRLKVRPGITGWWQVKYQPFEFNLNEIENRLKDDFYYIENMSIRLDIEIVIRTVWKVLKGHGQT